MIRSGFTAPPASSTSIQAASTVTWALPLSPFSGAALRWEGGVEVSVAKMGLTQAWEGPITSSRSPRKTLAMACVKQVRSEGSRMRIVDVKRLHVMKKPA